MDFRLLFYGKYGTNTYLLTENSEAYVIDPDGDASRIAEAIGNNTLKGILLTHGHFDHKGAAAQLRDLTAAPIYIGEADADMCRGKGDLAFLASTVSSPFAPDVLLYDNDKLHIGGTEILVLHTPGHSLGSMTFSAPGRLFVGDLIFEESVGRTDFGSAEDLLKSIERLMARFDDDTLILPGHGGATTIGHERQFNPYIKR